jgi:hypothetical protein
MFITENGSFADRLLDVLHSTISKIKEISKALIKALKNRFPSIDNLTDFEVLAPSIIKQLHGNELDLFGCEQLKKFLNYYQESQYIDNNGNIEINMSQFKKEDDSIFQEYNTYKHLVHNEYKNMEDETIFQKICSSNFFPNLSKLLCIFLAIPLDSVECERMFSAINLIKTKQRNRLESETLNDLMMIYKNGPPMNNSISKWPLKIGKMIKNDIF